MAGDKINLTQRSRRLILPFTLLEKWGGNPTMFAFWLAQPATISCALIGTNRIKVNMENAQGRQTRVQSIQETTGVLYKSKPCFYYPGCQRFSKRSAAKRREEKKEEKRREEKRREEKRKEERKVRKPLVACGIWLILPPQQIWTRVRIWPCLLIAGTL